jgi:hypothetical protein
MTDLVTSMKKLAKVMHSDGVLGNLAIPHWRLGGGRDRVGSLCFGPITVIEIEYLKKQNMKNLFLNFLLPL